MLDKVSTMAKTHIVSLRDAALLIGAVLAVGIVAFEYDFSGNGLDDKRIELQEAIGLGVVFVSAMLFFGWWRIAEQEREIARRIAAERRAHELAHTDALTGLANRRQFEQALKETV